jgi:hypothetical protein
MNFRSQSLLAVVAVGLVVNACGGKGQENAAGAAGTNGAGTPQTGGGAGTPQTGGSAGTPTTGGTSSAGTSTGGSPLTGGASAAAGNGSAGSSGGALGGSGSGGGGGGNAGGGGGGVDGAATVKLLQPTVDAFCAAARSCCAKQSEPATLTDCESAFPSNNATVASLASGAATLDPTALAACLAAYQAAATSCNENPVLSACRGVVIGTRPENAPCTNGAECLRVGGSNTCLITEQNGTVGVCRKIAHHKAGDACDFTCRKGEDCTSSTYGDAPLDLCFEDDGVYCDYLHEPATCKSILTLGAACTDDEACGSTGFCQTTCQKRGVEGDPCTRCLDSLSCINGKCQSPPFASANTCEGRSLGPY